MLTADTITDEQIRELLEEPPIKVAPRSSDDKTDYAWFRREVYRMALDNGQGRIACRARCAEILNARAVDVKHAPVMHRLGGGPHFVERQDNGDGTFSITFRAAPYGHGNSRREAAKHLADQLRKLAHLVEAQEGQER